MPPLRALGLKIVFPLLAVFTTVVPADRAAAGESAKTVPCAAPVYRQFDFWIGDWDAFDVDKPSTAVARNHVESILGGCALHEDYRATSGSRGESFTIYDGSRNIWHQTWVTNAGKLLVIEGTGRNGEIVLTGVDRKLNGRQVLVRGIWKPVKQGVRETAITSNDGGATWRPWFDILFRPHSR